MEYLMDITGEWIIFLKFQWIINGMLFLIVTMHDHQTPTIILGFPELGMPQKDVV